MFTTVRYAAFAACCYTACSAFAADPVVQKIDPNQPVGAIVESHASTGVLSPDQNDARIVRWLSLDNRALVDCARMAADRSGNSALKEFAQHVADDHQKFQDHFGKKHATAKDVQPKTGDAQNGASADTQKEQATLVRDDGRSRDGAMIFRPTDFLMVKEHVCQKMQSLAKKEMEHLNGTDFDRAFISHMVFGHEALTASIDAVDNSASQALQPQLKELRDVVSRHLDEARRLHDQVMPASTAAREGKDQK
jgi:predicted outer membrane protein